MSRIQNARQKRKIREPSSRALGCTLVRIQDLVQRGWRAGKSLQDATVAVIVTGQLLPFAEAAPEEAAEPAPSEEKPSRQAGLEALLGPGYKDPLQSQVGGTRRPLATPRAV